jgi:hypothetical protein
VDVHELQRWLEARGVTDERLAAYRACVEQILREAGGMAVEPQHVEAARRSLQAAGCRPRTLAHLKDAADALRRFQRGDGAQPSSTRPSSIPPPAPVTPAAARPLLLGAVTPQGPRALYVAAAVVAGMVMVGVAAGAYVWMFKAATDMEATFSAAASPEEPAVRQAYEAFQKAMLAGDLPALRALAAQEQLTELNADDAEQKIALAKTLYPAQAKITMVRVVGDTAVIKARALMGEQRANGDIQLAKEAGSWKIRKVDWKVTFGQGSAEDARDVARPADLPQLQGTWKGRETSSSTDWTLTFSSGYRLSASSSRGESYSGEVMIRWDLGVESDSIRVPPGWAPLDVEIDHASSPQAVGKVALSAFSLSPGELKLCGGPPGFGRRVTSFDSPGPEFRCMVLSRLAGAAEPAPAADAAPPVDAAPAADSPGEATLLLDGVAEQYVLQTGFFSETRVATPERATLHFAIPAPPHSNARRILLTLDATRTGAHYADAQAIHDMMFNDKPVAVGQLNQGARAAVLMWVADGGQHYPPKLGTRCEITVSSPYTGNDDSEFRAEIAHCAVHSAGIDRTLSSVKLRVKGKLDR